MRKLFGNTVVVTWPDGDTSNWRLRQRGLARLRRRKQSLDRRPGLERELSLIDRQIGHLGDAVKRGRATDELLAMLEAESDPKKAIARELAALDDGARPGVARRRAAHQAAAGGRRRERTPRLPVQGAGDVRPAPGRRGRHQRVKPPGVTTTARRRAPHRADYIVRCFR